MQLVASKLFVFFFWGGGKANYFGNNTALNAATKSNYSEPKGKASWQKQFKSH